MSSATLAASLRANLYDRRRDRRMDVDLLVQVEADRFHRSGKLEELSRTGARLRFTGTLPVNQIVILNRAGLELIARVVWSKDGRTGVEFRYPLTADNFVQLRRAPN